MERKIYIGPYRPYGLSLMTNAILQSYKGIPGLEKALEEHPMLKKMMVSIGQLVECRKRVVTQGDPLQEAYLKIIKETDELRNNKGSK